MRCEVCNVLDTSNWDGNANRFIEEYGDFIPEEREYVYIEILLPI